MICPKVAFFIQKTKKVSGIPHYLISEYDTPCLMYVTLDELHPTSLAISHCRSFPSASNVLPCDCSSKQLILAEFEAYFEVLEREVFHGVLR